MSAQGPNDRPEDDELDFDLAGSEAGELMDEPLSDDALDFELDEFDTDRPAAEMAEDEFPLIEEADGLPLMEETLVEADHFETASSSSDLADDQWIPTVEPQTFSPAASAPASAESDLSRHFDPPTHASDGLDSDREPPTGTGWGGWVAITACLLALGALAFAWLKPAGDPAVMAQLASLAQDNQVLVQKIDALETEVANAPRTGPAVESLMRRITSLEQATQDQASTDDLTRMLEEQQALIQALQSEIQQLQTQSTQTTTSGQWSVHVSSFSRRANAESIRDELRNAGYPAEVHASEVQGRTWYRISLSGFSDRGEADLKRREIGEKLGYTQAWISRD